MTDDTFENLEVWKDGIELAAKVYERLRECRDYGFRSQMQEASVSVPSNIAEGYERDTNAEFVRFLVIAKGSCGEVRSQAHLARRIKLLPEPAADELIGRARRLSKRLARFIAVRRENFS
jgi:four helix bundle protein